MSSEQSESAFGGYSTAKNQQWAKRLMSMGDERRRECRAELSRICGQYLVTINTVQLKTLEAKMDAVDSFTSEQSTADRDQKLKKVAEWQSDTNYTISFDYYLGLG